MKLSWVESLNSKQIALNNYLFKELLEPKNIIINFGSLRLKMEAMLGKDLSKGTIGLPKNLSEIYTIPTDIPYECYVKEQEIYIGPIIAHVALGHFKDLKNRIYYSFLPEFMDFHSINGLVIICTSDSIDLDSNIIEGYYFDPQEKEPKKVWKYGKFPLPYAIFNRSFMSKKKISIIQGIIGDTVFNSYWYNLNKWRIWENISKDKTLEKHLPYTEKYLGTNQVKKLVDRYKSIYLKPCSRSRGIGIMKLTKERKGFLLFNDKMQIFLLKDFLNLSQFLQKKIKIPYIIQQAVPYKVNNQHLDFRLILQKDRSKNWICSGLIGRVAPKGVIITNFQGKPKLIPGQEALATYYNLNKEGADKMKKEITKLVIKAVERYENMGLHLGDLAADFIIDSNLHVWLLELQLNYAIYQNTNILTPEFFTKVLTTPFQYAKALAGFIDDK